MNVMDLVAKISLDSGDYEKGVSDAKNSFSNLGSAIASGAKTAGKLAVGAFAAIGTAVVGATTALVDGAKETAIYADNIDKMSQKMGFSTDAFQEWDFIAQHSGTSIDAIKGSLMKLDKALDSDTDAWERLGLSQEELLNMSAEDKFEATVAALQGITDETEKAALAEDIFGKSYQELMPLLNQTTDDIDAMKQEVHDLGGVMSEEAVKAGADFKDSLQNLQTAVTGMKNNLMGEFLPSITTVMDGLTALFTGDSSGIEKIKNGITEFASKINEVLPQAIQTVSSVAEALIGALPSLLSTVASELPNILNSLIPVLIESVVSLADAVVSALPSIMSAIQSNIGVITSGISRILSALGKILMTLLPTLLPTMLQVAINLVKELAKGFSENADMVIQTVFELINLLVEELTNPDTLMSLLECGLAILSAVVTGISNNLNLLLEAAGTLLVNLATFLVEAIPELVSSIGQNGATIITDVLPSIILAIGNAGANLLDKVTDVIAGWIPSIVDFATTTFEAIGDGVSAAWDWIKEKVGEISENILGWFTEKFLKIKQIGDDLVHGLWNGINDAKDWVIDKIKSFTDDVLNGIKSFFGIASPSKKTAIFGRYLAEGLAVGFEDEVDNTFDTMQDAIDDGLRGLTSDTIGIDTIGNVGIKSSGMGAGATSDTAYGILSKIYDMLLYIANQDAEYIFPITIGTQPVEEIIFEAKRNLLVKSGGQVDL